MARNDVTDERIIDALLSTPTVEAAAEACGVSARTIFRRLEDWSFQASLSEALEGVRKAREAKGLSLVDEAFATLQRAMRDPASPPSVRVRAAEIALAKFWR